MELGKEIYRFIEPGLKAISPVQLGSLDSAEQKPVLIDHDRHVRVYRQDFVLQQARNTFESAPLGSDFRNRAGQRLSHEISKASVLGSNTSRIDMMSVAER